MNFLLFGADPAPRPDEALRSITLCDRIVPYTLKRSQRRSLSITIDHRGLRVLGPLRTSIREAEQLLHQHEAWIRQKLDEWRPERLRRNWQIADGALLPYLGSPLPLRLETHGLRTPRVVYETVASDTEYETEPACEGETAHASGQLVLRTANFDDHVRNQRALVQWLRAQALACFGERVAVYAARLDVPTPPLALTQAKTRWGSCNNRGQIRLNWRLIHLPLSLIDYVVAHELAHLKEMNHSPRFWAIVGSIYPDWQASRRALRAAVSSLPVIEI